MSKVGLYDGVILVSQGDFDFHIGTDHQPFVLVVAKTHVRSVKSVSNGFGVGSPGVHYTGTGAVL